MPSLSRTSSSSSLNLDPVAQSALDAEGRALSAQGSERAVNARSYSCMPAACAEDSSLTSPSQEGEGCDRPVSSPIAATAAKTARFGRLSSFLAYIGKCYSESVSFSERKALAGAQTGKGNYLYTFFRPAAALKAAQLEANRLKLEANRLKPDNQLKEITTAVRQANAEILLGLPTERGPQPEETRKKEIDRFKDLLMEEGKVSTYTPSEFCEFSEAMFKELISKTFGSQSRLDTGSYSKVDLMQNQLKTLQQDYAAQNFAGRLGSANTDTQQGVSELEGIFKEMKALPVELKMAEMPGDRDRTTLDTAFAKILAEKERLIKAAPTTAQLIEAHKAEEAALMA